MRRSATLVALAGCLTLTWAGSGRATLTAAQKCQASKLKAAGKDAACQANALAKAALGGVNTVSQCDAKLAAVFAKLEAKGGCATKNDAPITTARIDLSSIIAQASFFYPGGPGGPTNGLHFTDNGDGTVTDNNTGLQWEQKNDDPTSVHYAFGFYSWSSTGCAVGGGTDNGTAPDGTAFTSLLATLNNSAGAGCFAGHCDWRLPTAAELGTILDPHAPGCGQPPQGACIDPIFGPADQAYWSSDTEPGAPTLALLTFPFVNRSGMPVDARPTDKCTFEAMGYPFIDFSARAVRSVSGPNCGSAAEPCCSGAMCNDPDTVCSAGGTCVACGAGGLPCCAGQTDCAGTCVTLATDPNNCGACGSICRTGAGFVCTAGACLCPAGDTLCGSQCNVSALCYCANLQTDNNNCGSCGHVCTTLPVCIGGVCTIP